MKWAIKARKLYDGTRNPAVDNGVVVMENDRIVAAGPSSQVNVPSDAEVVDVGDRTVMPGIIDAHVHIMTSGGPSSISDARAMSREQLILQGAQNGLKALRSGLTTVRDCGDYDYITLQLRDSINQGLINGPRIVASGPVITTTAGQLWWWGIEADTTEEIRKGIRTLAKNGVDFIKVMGSGGNATPGSNPEVSQYDLEGYQVMAEDAHRMGKMVAVHVHGNDAIRMAVDVGIDTLEHVPFRANGTIEYDEGIVRDMVRKGTIVSLAFPATWYRMRAEEMREARNHPGQFWEGRYETVRKMHAAGVKLVVSSDQGSTGTRIDELSLLMAFLVNQLELPSADVLYGVTGLAAEAVGMKDKIGTLEEGKLADVVVVDGDPLADISAMERIHTVVKGGEVVVRDGMLVV